MSPTAPITQLRMIGGAMCTRPPRSFCACCAAFDVCYFHEASTRAADFIERRRFCRCRGGSCRGGRCRGGPLRGRAFPHVDFGGRPEARSHPGREASWTEGTEPQGIHDG